jgi:Ca2+-binding RTX toxin-like protein
VWYKVFCSADPGTNALFTPSAGVNADLTISTFHGVDSVAPIDNFAVALETVQRFGHPAPGMAIGSNVTIVHHWTDRSSATTEYFAPRDQITLATSIGAGPAHISSVTTVRSAPESGSTTKSVAIAEHVGRAGTGWTIALKRSAPMCDGLAATVDIAAGQVPTAGDDVIDGGDDADTISSGTGDDHLFGGPGDDFVTGSTGNDTINSTNGVADIVNGGQGIDACIVDLGIDTAVFNCA